MLSRSNKNSDEKTDTRATSSTSEVQVSVTPITHATAVLGWGDVVIYTDPTGGPGAFLGQPSPTIILVTDIHGDHLSTSTLNALVGEKTALIVPPAVKAMLPPGLALRALELRNGETLTEQNLNITAIPMYNLPEAGDSRHPRGRGNGYVIASNDLRVYIAGDTAGIPEMRTLKDIDIAFVPMNLPYTMGVEEAADAVLEFKPKQVYPYHYRGEGGRLADILKFKTLVNAGNPDINVVLADWYPVK